MVKVDGRMVLKQGQIDILELLYKYRFGSRQLIADSLNIKAGSSLHERLAVLIKHGYVNKRLDKAQRLYGMPAAYFLTPKGLKFMRSLPNHEYITELVIKSSYKDKSTSLGFITHNLDVYRLIIVLKRRYPELKAYLRRDMGRFSYFPKLLPDVFLSLSDGTTTKRFFFDYIPDSQERKVFFQRISSYIYFFDRGGWKVTNAETPILLFVAEKAGAERRIRRLTNGVINKVEPDEVPDVYTTTKKAIEQMGDEGLVWTHIDDDDELIGLNNL